jgi:hypothetical protein
LLRCSTRTTASAPEGATLRSAAHRARRSWPPLLTFGDHSCHFHSLSSPARSPCVASDGSAPALNPLRLSHNVWTAENGRRSLCRLLQGDRCVSPIAKLGRRARRRRTACGTPKEASRAPSRACSNARSALSCSRTVVQHQPLDDPGAELNSSSRDEA